ncbi:MAG: Nif3-like dinuclear metal center hexameric protein [Salibacteraceae bacterium]
MLLKELIKALEELAPPSYQESYDNAGLICGNVNEDVKSVLCTLDCTEAVVEEAIQKGCNIIIAHHPIVFKALKQLTGKNYIERTIIKAIKNDIVIYAIHTNLDNVIHGVNAKIGQVLGLSNLEILKPKKEILKKLITFVPKTDVEPVRSALFYAGAGNIGHYDHCSFNVSGHGTFRGGEQANPYKGKVGNDHIEEEIKIEVIFPAQIQGKVLSGLIKAHPYEEVAYDIISLENQYEQVGSGMIGTFDKPQQVNAFLQLVATRLNCSVIRHTKKVADPIKKVAFCGGSGSFLLSDAIQQQADVFITSDYKYHDFFDAEDRIMILDVGHFESEQFTPNLIKEYLEGKFSTFAVLLSEVQTNPVHYFIS